MQIRTVRWTPLRMPQARRSYAASLRRTASLLRGALDGRNNVPLPSGPNVSADGRAWVKTQTRMARSASEAALMWVTDAMTAHADLAAETIPPTWTPGQILAEPNGILSWERSPITTDFDRPDILVPIHAVHWETHENTILLHLLTLARMVTTRRPLNYRPEDHWALITTIDFRADEPIAAKRQELHPRDQDLVDLFAATLHLSQQATSTETAADWSDPTRPGKRPRPTPDVQVIDLRRNQRAPRQSSSEPRPIEHDHRWEVGHHWRTQHYGPGNSLSRLVFIDDYVQGPDDKPLRRRERVYRLCR